MNNLKFKIETSLSNIKKADWNRCAKNSFSKSNPFVCYEFLDALERSNSLNNDTGWFSTYLIIENESLLGFSTKKLLIQQNNLSIKKYFPLLFASISKADAPHSFQY